MVTVDSLHPFFRYSDWANGQLLHAGSGLADESLDRPFDIGLGSLRRTLTHVWAGEHVWLQRWQGRTETPWPDETAAVAVVVLAERFGKTYAARDVFLRTLTADDLAKSIVYRDSKGSLFTASLSDMLMQGVVHSIHHRAQCVNMLRRLGAGAPELDYMMWVRRPV